MTTNRLAYAFVAAMFTYIGIEYLIERHTAFVAWRKSFIAPFLNHPGRREFLRDALLAEEFNDA